MDTAKLVGIFLLVAGALGLAYGSFSYTKETHQAKRDGDCGIATAAQLKPHWCRTHRAGPAICHWPRPSGQGILALAPRITRKSTSLLGLLPLRTFAGLTPK